MATKRLYIGSIETYSGKSAVGLGLALHYKEKGLQVGYFKPVGNLPMTVNGHQTDEDAFYVSQALGNSVPVEALAPVLLTTQVTDDALHGEGLDAPARIRTAFDQVAKNKDLVVIEGAADLFQGKMLGASVPEMSAALDAPVLLVIRSTSPLIVDEILGAQQTLGGRLAGVVFVSLPQSSREQYAESVCPYLEEHGVRVLGLLPQERTLMSVSVGELAEALGAEILCAREKSEELVETYLVGAMGQEKALRFFRRKAEKAVITGGDRADVQLAALETPTKCLILTGNLYPSQAVIARAEQQQVPIILAPQDTFTVVEIVESTTGRIGFHQPRKVNQMRKILEEHFDFDTLNKTLQIEA